MKTSLNLSPKFTFVVALSLAMALFAPMGHAAKEAVPVEEKQQGFYNLLVRLKEQHGMMVENIRYDEATDLIRIENITFPAMKASEEEPGVNIKDGELKIDLLEVHQPQWQNFAKDSTALLAEKLVFTNISQLVGDATTPISRLVVPQTILVKPEINPTAAIDFFTKELDHKIVAKLLEGNVSAIEFGKFSLKFQSVDWNTGDPYYEDFFIEKFSTRPLPNGFVDVEIDGLEVKNLDTFFNMKKARIEKLALPTQAELLQLNEQIQASAYDDDIFSTTLLPKLTTFRPGRPHYAFVEIQQVSIQTLNMQDRTKEVRPLLNLENYQSRFTSPTAQNSAFTAENVVKGNFFTQSLAGENSPATPLPFDYTFSTELQPGAKVSTIMANGNGSGHELYLKLGLLLNLAEDLNNVALDETTIDNIFITGNLATTDIVYKDTGLMNSLLALVAKSGNMPLEAERQSWIAALQEAKATLKTPQDIKNVENLISFCTKPGTLRISQTQGPMPMIAMITFILSPFTNLPFNIVAE